MSHAHGTYLGGVRTLECVRQRCVVDDLTGCWLLRQSKGGTYSDERNNGNRPRLWVPGRGSVSAQRVAWELSHSAAPARGQVVFHTCDRFDCVNPAHLRLGTKRDEGKHLIKRGHLRGDPARAATNAQNARNGPQAKLTHELAQWIRESTQSNKAVAHALNVSHNIASEVRLGKSWHRTCTAASVFSWRPAP